MLKTSSKQAGALPATDIENGEVVSSSSGNNRKLAKSDFTKPVHGVEEPSFLITNAR